MSQADIPKTYGALLIGGLFASLLSGTVSLQTLAYFRIYTTDLRRIKMLVFMIWLLDTGHTAFIWATLWQYLISYYQFSSYIDFIPWSLSLSIVFTAILTFLVHCFFAHRIFLLGSRNWALTAPILILAVLRLASASVTTSEMLRLQSFTEFKANFRWVFTLGLALSSSVDVYITTALFVLLQISRSGTTARMKSVIDSLVLYAFETGSLTCAATIVSMICWIVISKYLVFMGLHFVIGKLYATSLLVTLNTRRGLQKRPLGGVERYVEAGDSTLDLAARRAQREAAAAVRPGVTFTDISIPTNLKAASGSSQVKSVDLQISVERSVQYTVETFHRDQDFYTSMSSARY